MQLKIVAFLLAGLALSSLFKSSTFLLSEFKLFSKTYPPNKIILIIQQIITKENYQKISLIDFNNSLLSNKLVK